MKDFVTTVNVLEVFDNKPFSIMSFLNTKEGRKEAKKIFWRCAIKAGAEGASPEEKKKILDDKYFEVDQYQVYILYSEGLY